ncbi:GlxA family transcriptional regulator [Dongia deserti]|uniref:GlxA family transcriptional regulator n=1 Tax=Dongia deserti TaxID=2268030 RepID=UPI002547964C|nr:helix-turn-helix domain-containing protein [Dongia deserti]
MGEKRIHVSLVVFPECDPSIIYGVFDTLWFAGAKWESGKGLNREEALFELQLVTAEPGLLQLCTGVSILSQATIAEVTRTDVVFVPNVMIYSGEDLRALDRRLLEWITRMHAQGSHLYAACGGSFVLAEAGLLNGQQATTHLGYAPLFRQQYPNIELHEDRVLVQAGHGHSIACCGGASSWQDLALLLVAKYGGTEEAIRMSKFFLYQWHRDGQLPYASMTANVQHGDAVILRCQTWLAENYERPDIVTELVRRSGLPKRTFDRRFRAATGYSPLAYVQTLRIEEAKHLLETGTRPIEEIAREVGYEDLASFRRLFRRLAGMSPGDYRRKLQLPALIGQLAARQSSQLAPQRPAIKPRSARSGTASPAGRSRPAAARSAKSARG